MKRILFLLTLALIIFSNNQLQAKHYIDIHKHGGILAHYYTVTQTFDGTNVGGDEFYTLTCTNPGWDRCRFSSHGRTVPSISQGFLEYCASTMDNMTTSAENSILAGTLTGTSTVHLVGPYGVHILVAFM